MLLWPLANGCMHHRAVSVSLTPMHAEALPKRTQATPNSPKHCNYKTCRSALSLIFNMHIHANTSCRLHMLAAAST